MEENQAAGSFYKKGLVLLRQVLLAVAPLPDKEALRYRKALLFRVNSSLQHGRFIMAST